MNNHTKQAIADRLEELEDHCSECDVEDAETWQETVAALRAVAGGASLSDNRLASVELLYLLDRDEYWTDDLERRNARGKAILADMCRAGFFVKHDADAVSTHRPKTMVVDGVRYDVG